ncbi:MAG: LysM peptidoglycan-binding domain-containing protein [Kiritimatiellaeota bacterium]|nr:LysM peptidoglycan-binding domain-containing protein [Kiritimatiellota bacterium]
MKALFHFIPHAACAALLLLAAGCDESGSWQDSRDERDPALLRARAAKNAQDFAKALELYNETLERRPRLAAAHLEVGMLYEKKEDFIRALYHYQRYLELRPAAQKNKLVEDMIRVAKVCYAASLPNPPPGAIEEIALLKRENASLRAQLHKSAPAGSPTLGATNASLPLITPKPPAPPQPVAAQPAVRTYIVQPGDTLASIAYREYKDRSKAGKIFEANRDTLTAPQSIKAGQTLIIP